MKEHVHKKYAGVWLDHSEAHVISTPDHTAHGEYGIQHKVKATHHAFHSSNENASNHQRHAELEKYLQEVSKYLEPFDEVLVFGPGQAQEQLLHHVQNNARLKNVKLVLGTAGSRLSDGQVCAQVAEHFKKYAF